MAYGVKYTAAHEGPDGAAWVLEIQLKDYVGSSTPLQPHTSQYLTLSYPESDTSLWPSELTIRVEGQSALDLVDDLFGQRSRDVRVVVRRGGALYWMGYAVTDPLSTPLDVPRVVTIRANDGLEFLHDELFHMPGTQVPYSGRATAAELIIEQLRRVHDLPVRLSLAWTEAGAPGNTLDGVTIDRKRFYTRGDDVVFMPFSYPGSTPQTFETYEAATRMDVLTTLLSSFLLRARLSDGEWHVQHEPHYWAGQWTEYVYPASSSSFVSVQVDRRRTTHADIDEERWRRGGAVYRGEGAYDAVRVTYAHGTIGSLLPNGGFEDVKPRENWLEPPEVSGWVLTAGAHWTKGGQPPGKPLGDKGKGSDGAIVMPAFYRDHRDDTPFLQMMVGRKWNYANPDRALLGAYDHVTSEPVPVEVSPGHRLQIKVSVMVRSVGSSAASDSSPGPAANPTLYLYAMAWIKEPSSGIEHYLTEDGSWSSGSPQAFSLGEGGAVFDVWTDVTMNAQQEVPVVGEFRLRLYTVMEGGVYFWDDPVWDFPGLDERDFNRFARDVLYDNVAVTFVDETTGAADPAASTLISFASREEPRMLDLPPVLLGDGPTAAHLGALRRASGGALTSSWSGAGAGGVSLTQALADAVLRARRKPLRRLQTTFLPDALSPGAGFLAVLAHELVVRQEAGGSTTFAPRSLVLNLSTYVAEFEGEEVRQDGFAPSYDVFTSDRVGGFASGIESGLARYIQHQDERVASFIASRAFAVTRAVIMPGQVTSIPVEAMPEPLLKDGNTFALQDPATAEVHILTTAQNQVAGATSISIEPYAFDRPVAHPAPLYAQDGEILSLLSITPYAFRLWLQNSALAVVDGDQTVAPQNPTPTLVTRGALYDVEAGRKLYVLDHETGARTDLVLRASVSPGTLSLPLEAPLALSVNDGSAIFIDAAEFEAGINVTAQQVEVLAQERRTLDETVGGLMPVGVLSSAASGTMLTLSSPGLLASLPNGAKMAVLPRLTGLFPSWAPLVPLTLNDAAAVQGDTTVTVGQSVTAAAGSLLYYDARHLAQRTQQTEGSLTVLSSQVTAKVDKSIFALAMLGAAPYSAAQAYNGNVTLFRVQQGAPAGGISSGTRFIVTNTATGGRYPITLSADVSDSDIYWPINAATIVCSVGDPVYADAQAQQVEVDTLTARVDVMEGEIDLSVTKAALNERLFGGIVALLNGSYSTSPRTSFLVKTPLLDGGFGSTAALKEGEVVVIVDKGSGETALARVSTDHAAGSTVLAIEDPVTGGSVSFPTLMDDGSPVFRYLGTPDILRTGINVSLGTIRLDANEVVLQAGGIIRSSDYVPGMAGLVLRGSGVTEIESLRARGSFVSSQGGQTAYIDEGRVALADGDHFTYIDAYGMWTQPRTGFGRTVLRVGELELTTVANHTLELVPVSGGGALNGNRILTEADQRTSYHEGLYGGAPPAGTGATGDIAYDIDLGGKYIKTSGGWVAL